jgi:putative FmdB family regulatory protein
MALLHQACADSGETPMPMYEYACQDCSREFETLVRSGTQPACPACKSTKLEKLLSVFATAGAGGAEAAARAPMPMGPCGSCGHPDGPGSCAVH